MAENHDPSDEHATKEMKTENTSTEANRKRPSDAPPKEPEEPETKRPKLDETPAEKPRQPPDPPSSLITTSDLKPRAVESKNAEKATSKASAKKPPKAQAALRPRNCRDSPAPARSNRKPIEQRKSFADMLARMAEEAKESEERLEEAIQKQQLAQQTLEDAEAVKAEAAKVFSHARLLLDNMTVKHKAGLVAREKKIDQGIARMEKLEQSMRGMNQNLKGRGGMEAAEVDRKIAALEAKVDLKFAMFWVRLVRGMVTVPKDFMMGGMRHALSQFTKFCLPVMTRAKTSDVKTGDVKTSDEGGSK